MVYDQGMTLTPIRPNNRSPLADDVRVVRAIPGLARRREIRNKARLSLAQVGLEVGVSGTAVWQWEKLVELLPVTERTARYARLLAELDRDAAAEPETPK
jgi:DNA-binding XRE family transcriptional regulator